MSPSRSRPPESDIWGVPLPPRDRAAFRPSPIFLGIVAVFAGSGWTLWTGQVSAGVSAFAFVLSGWLLSLCLHEYAHAVVAYHGGDRSIADQGYLTLNPLKYTHAVLSIGLPLLFVLLGGIGLPGGAVYVDRAALRGRLRESLVSAAGPLTNIVFAVLTLGPVAVAFAPDDPSFREHIPFWAALAFLGFLQVTASLLNLLPVPGFDGFGICEPWLPRRWVATAAKVGPFGFLVVFAVLWIPGVGQAFFGTMSAIVEAVGVPRELVALGHDIFTFWS